ncbi:MAG TPA: hypothetical protein VHL77_11780, partial [Ferruginibacter sp.]|nr:hypothetical protein [Ferruginibacter sp.]
MESFAEKTSFFLPGALAEMQTWCGQKLMLSRYQNTIIQAIFADLTLNKNHPMRLSPAGAIFGTVVRKTFASIAAIFIICTQSSDAQIPTISSFTPTTGGTGTV